MGRYILGLDAGNTVIKAIQDAYAKKQPAVPVDQLQAAVHSMQQRQQAFSAEMSERLQETLSNLKHLQERQIEQLELRLEKQGGLENLRQGKRDRRVGQIRRVFDEYETWVRDSLQTEPHPYSQVLAAVQR